MIEVDGKKDGRQGINGYHPVAEIGGWMEVREVNNSVTERAYQESLRDKYEVWRGGRSRMWRRSGKSSEI